MAMDDACPDPLSLLGRRLPASVELRLVTIPPGGRRAYDPAEWSDALVVVERGELELDPESGAPLRFRRGAVLWLAGLPLRRLANRGSVPVVLAAVSRLGGRPAGE
jgi:hypothetical protein